MLNVSGILYARIDDVTIENALKIGANKVTEHGLIHLKHEHMHVTLVNQKYLKGKHKQQLIKTLSSNNFEIPRIILDDAFLVTREDKKSIIVVLKNQDEFHAIVSTIMKNADIHDYDKDRVFHISIANIDGSPYSSVGDVNWNDICIV